MEGLKSPVLLSGAAILAAAAYWFWPLSDSEARRRLTERETAPNVIAALEHAKSAAGADWTASMIPFLDDTRLAVRQRAAIALAHRGSASGRRVLLAALQSTTVSSPRAGVINIEHAAGSRVSEGQALALVGGDEVPAPMHGAVLRVYPANGASVAIGERICDLATSDEDASEVIEALGKVGVIADLDAIRRWSHLPSAGPAIQSIQNRRK